MNEGEERDKIYLRKLTVNFIYSKIVSATRVVFKFVHEKGLCNQKFPCIHMWRV